jgi:hypothetical protein
LLARDDLLPLLPLALLVARSLLVPPISTANLNSFKYFKYKYINTKKYGYYDSDYIIKKYAGVSPAIRKRCVVY